MVISEQIIKQYFNALVSQSNDSYMPMEMFKNEHPFEYKHITCIYHKRVKLRYDLNVMMALSNNKVYWGTLTYNDSKDKNKISSKRKEATRFLSNVFRLWLMVEEFGGDNGRYHIHFIGVFNEGKTFNDVFRWTSREDIQKVKSITKVARYLCDYVTKNVPRIRRNKELIRCSNLMKKANYYEGLGFQSIAAEYMNKLVEDYLVNYF